MTVNASLTAFLRDIEPSATTKANAAAAHSAFREHIASAESFKSLHLTTFLSGSYKRDTAIRPRQKGQIIDRPDIDIVCVANADLTANPYDIFAAFKDAVKEKYTSVQFDSRSVSVSTSIADMDAIVVIQPIPGGTYYLPDRNLRKWIATNPNQHTQWSTVENARFAGRFKPLVKLVKWWRREHPTISKQPKGILLEKLISLHAPTTVEDYPTLFVQTLDQIALQYEYLAMVPPIWDPAGTRQSLTQGLSEPAFAGFIKKAREHSDYVKNALDGVYEDATDATNAWRVLFGSRFPKIVGGEVKKSAGVSSLMDSSSNVPVATFPNRPILPSKPRGFAEAE